MITPRLYPAAKYWAAARRFALTLTAGACLLTFNALANRDITQQRVNAEQSQRIRSIAPGP